jgi:hypothetical protein
VLLVLLTAGGFAWWYWEPGHDAVEKIPQLHAKSLDFVLEDLGEPDRRDEFPMTEAVGEFRVELFNTYPPDDPTATNVRIKELQWDYSRHHIAVWFHKVDGEWRALDTCRWKEGVHF